MGGRENLPETLDVKNRLNARFDRRIGEIRVEESVKQQTGRARHRRYAKLTKKLGAGFVRVGVRFPERDVSIARYHLVEFTLIAGQVR